MLLDNISPVRGLNPFCQLERLVSETVRVTGEKSDFWIKVNREPFPTYTLWEAGYCYFFRSLNKFSFRSISTIFHDSLPVLYASLG